MATVSLPEQPNLEQLRKQARELQRGIRAGDPRALGAAGVDQADPTFALHEAQHALAHRYGFPNWPRLQRHVTAIAERTWVFALPATEESPADRFLRLACVNYSAVETDVIAAAALVRQHPELPSQSLSVAAVCGDVIQVRRLLAERREAAGAPSGPYAWPPLMYLTYGRYPQDADAALTVARLLLDAGANPNDGRFFLGLPTPFTVLTGVFGGGEPDPAPHPHAIALARLLLSAGADANDGQTLYNRMFDSADDFLEVLFQFGLGRGDGGPWRRLLPDVLPAPEAILDGLIDWAVTHDQRERTALLAAHGVDLDRRTAGGLRPVELARRTGHPAMVETLVSLGAAPPDAEPVEAFIAAALVGDREAAHAAPPAVVRAARRARPGLVVWAANLQRPAAVKLLVELGFDVNAMARSDLMLEQPWQSALHTAVERDDAPLARRLLELGADATLRDRRFDGTPLDWARHLGRPELVALLTAGEAAAP
jgi:hypothetical protein